MEKFILKNGKEVKMGDKLIKHGVADTPLGKGFIVQEIIVNEKTLPELIKAGVLTPMKECPHKAGCLCRHCTKGEVPMDMNFYIEKIAVRLGWKPEKVCISIVWIQFFLLLHSLWYSERLPLSWIRSMKTTLRTALKFM